MKTICRLISVVLISMFVFSLTSCSGHEEIIPEKKSYTIKWDNWQAHIKNGEDEEEEHIIIPNVSGAVIDDSGFPISDAIVELIIMPDNLLKDEAISDSNGKFTFNNVKKGDYELIVSSSGNVIGKNHIKL
jgi:hypothetical protein